MKRGLVLGKFMPPHTGHLALINFAVANCDELIVLICYTKDEAISGEMRTQWLTEIYYSQKNISIIPFQYDANTLPNTSVSSKDVSKKWANKLKSFLPQVNIIFSSEKYGEYLAEFMAISYLTFDIKRHQHPVSSTLIRENPLKYWSFIPAQVQPYFVKKVAILGTESTGKSTLTENLAKYYNTSFVPEMAREIIQRTDECTFDHLHQIADLHAKTINEKIKTANKLLFVDTDLTITKSYSNYLFKKNLIVDHWIEQANNFDHIIFLDKDVTFVQDGTRLEEEYRNQLHDSHLSLLKKENKKFSVINGDWQNRFEQSCKLIETIFNLYD